MILGLFFSRIEIISVSWNANIIEVLNKKERKKKENLNVWIEILKIFFLNLLLPRKELEDKKF